MIDRVTLMEQKPMLNYALRDPPKTRWWLVALFCIGFLAILAIILVLVGVAGFQMS